MRTTLAMLAAVQMLFGSRPADARVFAFVVEQRRSFASGTSWGTVGPYERLDGTAYMEVDPRDPLNAVIVNLERAPKNKNGQTGSQVVPFRKLRRTTTP